MKNVVNRETAFGFLEGLGNMYGYDCVNVCSKIPSALISSATTEKDKVCVSQCPWGIVQLIF